MRFGHRHRDCERRSQTCWAWLLRAGFLVSLLMPVMANAQANRPTEYQVKAAYLFNFAKFVKWPSSAFADNIFPICILGSDPFGGVLDSTVAGERINGKRVIVRRVSSAADATNCRIVFVSDSQEGRLGYVISVLSRAPVLTVSDIEGFAEHQGMIEFVMDHDRVRFEVNLLAAQRSGLALSSELLKVATSVKGVSGE